MTDINFESLLLLSNVKCESDVELIMTNLIDLNYITISYPEFVVINTKQLVNCDNDLTVIKLMRSLSKLVYLCLKSDETTFSSLSQLFPNGFDERLKTLLIKIIMKISNNRLTNVNKPICSMPQLNHLKCCTKSSKCLLDLNLSTNTNTNTNTTQAFEQKIQIAISKEDLKDMTQGMAAIRRQLFEATNRSKSS